MRLPSRFLIAVALLVGASARPAAAAESLWLLRCTDLDVLARLADRGVVVSRIEGEAAFAFADGQNPALQPENGCAPLLLDAASIAAEHYLVFPPGGWQTDGVLPPLRLLYRADGVAVVSAPPGGAEQVRALGFEMAKLFRTPMRLVPRGGPRAAFPALLSTAAPIDSLVAGVSVDSLTATVTALQGIGTRRATKQGGREAATWIAAKFRSFGIQDVVIEQWTAGLAGNVIATIRGTTSPNDVYIVGGHYDSFVADSDFEPGADDNASGTAGVLECARICAQYPFANTVRFIAFGGEELGLLGSEAYAYAASSSGEWITGMINLDMIGYRASTSARDLDVIANTTSMWLLDAVANAAARFVPELPVKRGKLVSGSSDHASFWRYFYSAVFFHEDSRASSPYIHTINDVIGTSYNDPELALLSTRVLVATIVSLAGGPQVPVALESFEARPVADGVLLQWRVAAAMRAVAASIDVQRAESEEGPFERLNGQPLAADGTSYLDTTAPRDRPSWYRLVIRGTDGSSALGPVVAVTPSWEDAASRLLPVAWSETRDAVLVRYRIGAAAGPVRLAIHDVRGRLVRTLFAGRSDPGEHVAVWEGRTPSGERVARGVYLVVLQAGDSRQARRVVWVGP